MSAKHAGAFNQVSDLVRTFDEELTRALKSEARLLEALRNMMEIASGLDEFFDSDQGVGVYQAAQIAINRAEDAYEPQGGI